MTPLLTTGVVLLVAKSLGVANLTESLCRSMVPVVTFRRNQRHVGRSVLYRTLDWDVWCTGLLHLRPLEVGQPLSRRALE